MAIVTLARKTALPALISYLLQITIYTNYQCDMATKNMHALIRNGFFSYISLTHPDKFLKMKRNEAFFVMLQAEGEAHKRQCFNTWNQIEIIIQII